MIKYGQIGVKAMPANPIYKFKAELMDTDLMIWRELEVVNNIPMSKLGYILMSIFNMKGNHLFAFEVPVEDNFKICAGKYINTEENQKALEIIRNSNPKIVIEIPDPYDDFEENYATLDATKTKLNKVLTEVNEVIIFNYDFGDNWNIKLTLLEIYIDKGTHGREFPRVLAGQGLGIIEDCGGVGGLEDLLEAYAKKSGEDYESYVEWLGKEKIDFDKFDKNDSTYFAKCANAWFKESYEDLE